VISDQDGARVLILDASGAAVFEAASGGSAVGPDGADDDLDIAPVNQGGLVRLETGDYRVECSVGTPVSTAALHVGPASG
jgi:hypothetical protein